MLLVVGLLGCLCSVQSVVFGVPASWLRAREAAALPRPDPEELFTLLPGTRVLIAARLPSERPAGAAGLALYYVEAREQRSNSAESSRERPTGAAAGAAGWQLAKAAPPQVELLLPNDAPLLVQIPQTARFVNAQRIEQSAEESSENGEDTRRERRYVGYLPGQTLAIEGTWEGDGLLTAEAFSAGTPEAYLDTLGNQPGQLLLVAFFCGVVGVLSLGVGAALRLLGR
jgi:hypothetical protein